MRKHPSEASLALFAGGELSRWQRWNVGRHVEDCEQCRSEIQEFSALREDAAAFAGLPAVPWERLAAEMKANIRLGLEAGECVTEHPAPRIALNARALAACASLAALLVASLWLERPVPPLKEIQPAEAAFLEASSVGIQVKEGEQAMILLNARHAQGVHYVASGSTMRARYVDADSGNVTINNVYVE